MTTQRAYEFWNAAQLADAHPYLSAAGVRSHGLRIRKNQKGDEALVISILDAEGAVHGLQYVFDAAEGPHFFPAGLKLAGQFFLIGVGDRHEVRRITVLEDYLAAARHFEATGEAAAVAFSQANVPAVMLALAKRYPQAHIAEKRPKGDQPAPLGHEAPVVMAGGGRPASELPPAPVPVWADVRDFPYTPFYRSRLFSSRFNAVVEDSAWRRGVTLWLRSWDQVPAGSLPDDEVELCYLAGLGREIEEWNKVKAGALYGWAKHAGGRLYHPVVTEGVINALKKKIGARLKTMGARIAKEHAAEKRAELEEERLTLESQLAQLGTGSAVTNVVTGDKEKLKLKEKLKEKEKKVNPLAAPPAPAWSVKRGDSRKKVCGTQEDHALAKRMFTALKVVAPSAKEPNWDAWANAIRLMRVQDGRTLQDIEALFNWANRDSFWRTNILSPGTLREKWTQLDAKMRAALGVSAGAPEPDYSKGVGTNGRF